MANKVTKKVTSVQEYKDAVEAAEVLDLSLKEAYFSGTWELDTGEPVSQILRSTEIEGVGRKYFTVRLTDDTEEGSSLYKVRFATGWASGDAELILTFV